MHAANYSITVPTITSFTPALVKVLEVLVILLALAMVAGIFLDIPSAGYSILLVLFLGTFIGSRLIKRVTINGEIILGIDTIEYLGDTYKIEELDELELTVGGYKGNIGAGIHWASLLPDDGSDSSLTLHRYNDKITIHPLFTLENEEAVNLLITQWQRRNKNIKLL